MEQKNIVATLYLKEGKAVRSMTDFTPVDDVYQLCQLYNDSGIDKIIIFDLSTSDDEHEKNINTIKNINRNIEIKVCAGGNINRLEDVKKLLYAGCLQVIFNASKPSSVGLAKEASERFGKDRILVSVNNVDFIFKNQQSIEDTFHEVLVLNADILGSDAVILDLMMPVLSGTEACMKIREFSDVPIIMLTARSEDADKIIGLESGADDYITKPFNILELKARIRALLRRANAAPQQKQPETLLLTAGGITLDPEQRVAVKNGEIVELTAKEYDLIELLVKNPRRVYSRENLMDLVWGYTYAGDYRTVDVHIRRLREKLEENPAAPQHILTKWGVGYYLKD